MVNVPNSPLQLFNLRDDLGESKDLAAEQAPTVARLKSAFDAWNQHNIAPIFQNPKPANNAKKKAAKK